MTDTTPCGCNQYQSCGRDHAAEQAAAGSENTAVALAMNPLEISESDFDDQFTFRPDADGEVIWDEIPDVGSPNQVWTIVEGEGSALYAVPGVKKVNAIGYVVSEEPWPHENVVGVWVAPDLDDLNAEQASYSLSRFNDRVKQSGFSSAILDPAGEKELRDAAWHLADNPNVSIGTQDDMARLSNELKTHAPGTPDRAVTARKLHAAIVEGIDEADDVPSRHWLETSQNEMARLKDDISAAAIDRDLGRDDGSRFRELLDQRDMLETRIAAIEHRRGVRRDARIDAGTPTLNDMRSIDDDRQRLVITRRRAVMAADSARDAAQRYDSPETLARLNRAQDDEQRAEHDYRTVNERYERANAAWA